VNARASLVANGQPTEAVEPGEGALDDPARPPESATVSAIAIREDRADAPSAQFIAMAHRVVAAVTLHAAGPTARRSGTSADRGHRVDQREQLGDVVAVGGGQRRDERNPVAVGENMMLRPGLAAIGRVRSSFFPPRSARSEELSTMARAKSRRPRRRSSASRTACRRFQTPARCQRTRRRQQVIPEPQPISCGSIRHGIPLRSTNRMPVSAARSGIGGRPAYWRCRDRRFGSNGSMRCHNASSSKSGMPDRLQVGQATVPSLSLEYKRPVR
jgi:hypothetical protein